MSQNKSRSSSSFSMEEFDRSINELESKVDKLAKEDEEKADKEDEKKEDDKKEEKKVDKKAMAKATVNTGKATLEAFKLLRKSMNDGNPNSTNDDIKTAKAVLKVIDNIADLAVVAGPEGKAAGELVKFCTSVIGFVLSHRDENTTSVEQSIAELKQVIKQEFKDNRNYAMAQKINGQMSKLESEIKLKTLDINRGIQQEYESDKITNFTEIMGDFVEFFDKHKNCVTETDGEMFARTVLQYAFWAEYFETYLGRLKLSNVLYKDPSDKVIEDMNQQHSQLCRDMCFYDKPNIHSNFRMAGFYKLGAAKIEYIRVWLGREKGTVPGQIVNIQCYDSYALGCKRGKEGKDRYHVVCKKVSDFSPNEKKFVIFGGNYKKFQGGSDIVASKDTKVEIFSVGGAGYLFASSNTTDMPFYDLNSTLFDAKENMKKALSVATNQQFATNYGKIDKIKGVLVTASGGTVTDSTWEIGRDKNDNSLHWFKNVKHDQNLMAIRPGQVLWKDDRNYPFASNDYRYGLKVLNEAEYYFNTSVKKYLVANALAAYNMFRTFEPAENKNVEIIWSMKKIED